IGNMLIVNSLAIEIIPACVAISAYFLLLVLNLTIAMDLKKRVYSILLSFLALLILNILRIVILSSMYVEKFAYFEQVHLFFWYFLSTIFVVCIWFGTAYVFRIKNIPIYSDIKGLLKP
ncbi:MAG: pacearchaeosortase, partial [Nanoarchaeota archaeon]